VSGEALGKGGARGRPFSIFLGRHGKGVFGFCMTAGGKRKEGEEEGRVPLSNGLKKEW